MADDLLDTMRAALGIGITGPHIGESRRITVLELASGEVRIYVNPRIIWQSDELKTHEEASVSMPVQSRPSNGLPVYTLNIRILMAH